MVRRTPSQVRSHLQIPYINMRTSFFAIVLGVFVGLASAVPVDVRVLALTGFMLHQVPSADSLLAICSYLLLTGLSRVMYA